MSTLSELKITLAELNTKRAELLFNETLEESQCDYNKAYNFLMKRLSVEEEISNLEVKIRIEELFKK